MRKKISILLADDHEIMRDGLESFIKAQEDMEVVAKVGTGRSAVRMARELRPDVAILDIGMPDLNGIDATREIVENVSGVRVLGLSMHESQNMIGSMLRAGASGYLIKNCAATELMDAIHTVVAGKTYISPMVAGDLVQEYVCNCVDENENFIFSNLTPRERQILQLLAEGNNTKEIADQLEVSDKTVAAHRLKLMEKLDCGCVADLTRYAIRHGLVEA